MLPLLSAPRLQRLALAAILLSSLPALLGAGSDEPRVRVKVERFGFPRVERVPLERYVRGVVAAEVPNSWPAGALRAQAVASRTYALHRMAAARQAAAAYDVEASTTGQVFSNGPVAPAVAEAVAATRGEVLLYAGKPVLAAFHSASGGQTASAEEVWGESHPYLQSVRVPDEDDAPATYWRTPVSRHTMRRALEAYGLDVGRIRSIRVAERSPSGRVVQVRVTGDRAEALLSGRELRNALGETRVKSTLFDIRTVRPPAREAPSRLPPVAARTPERGPQPPDEPAGDFAIVGSGYGHGVGMSQWAARAMAERGIEHRDILLGFYRGARIERLAPSELTALAQGKRRPRAGGEDR